MPTVLMRPGAFYCGTMPTGTEVGLFLLTGLFKTQPDSPDKESNRGYWDFQRNELVSRDELPSNISTATASHIMKTLSAIGVLPFDFVSRSYLSALSADIQDALLTKASQGRSGRSADHLRAFREASEVCRKVLREKAAAAI